MALKKASRTPKLPSYSVLISVYAQEEPDFLELSLKSMFTQTHPPAEIVIVEDGPLTPELTASLDYFSANYPKIIKRLKLPKNQGLGPALAYGLKACQHQYIVRMDSDDYSCPKRAETQLNFLLDHPDYDLVGTNAAEFIGTPQNITSYSIMPEYPADILRFAKTRSPFRHPTVTFKKSAVLAVGNYQNRPLCEDYDLWLRLLQNRCKTYNIQQPLVYIRMNDSFYRRRHGLRYFSTIRAFKKEYLKNHFFTRREYLAGLSALFVVCLLPLFLRKAVYKSFLRSPHHV